MGFSFEVIEKAGVDVAAWRRLKAISREMKSGEAYVKAGILAPDATKTHDGKPQTLNVDIAFFNEFGTEHIPTRSFIREPFRRNRTKYLAALHELLPKVLKGEMDINRALKLVGLAMASDMKKAIYAGEGIPPPNSPGTVAQKGSSRPLVNTGTMASSITYAAVVPSALSGKGE